MTETKTASLRERAAAARAEHDAEAAEQLIRNVRDVLGVEIGAKDIAWHGHEPRYITEGLEFGATTPYGLDLYRVCGECGRSLGCAVSCLWHLDCLLDGPVPPHYCNVRPDTGPHLRAIANIARRVKDALRARINRG